MEYRIGMDLGNSSVKVIVLNNKCEIVYKEQTTHLGKPFEELEKIILKAIVKFDKGSSFTGMFTGVNSSLLFDKKLIAQDIPAIQKGVSFLYPNAKSAIEIGSQNARFLAELGKITPPKFAVNENCAGGTGSFFEDQMYRLGLKTEDYSSIIAKATSVPRLSGRCSVFAKTDIIHLQQEGISTPNILLGLCYATIRNLKATIIKNLPMESPLALCGGTVNNKGVIKAVGEIFKLSEDELLFSQESIYVQAIGAAIMSMEQKCQFSFEECLETIRNYLKDNTSYTQIMRLAPLQLRKNTITYDPVCQAVKEITHCSLGIDVGSTSTNIVLTRPNGEIIDFQYLRTKGNPQEVVRMGLLDVYEKFENQIIIDSVGVTGSGRYLIGKMVGADSIKDEITAQAKAAVCVNPNVDTVFEIGGQDSKYISISNSAVTDFQMNKICAAGTGSFIEEQASRLGVKISDYGKIALTAQSPVDLGERCTVFIESNISACLSKGAQVSDILAGLCHSVIRNYLFKVVGNKPIGNHIVLQGGVCYNPAIVAAFQSFYGDKVTVSPYFSISGAYGAAVIAAEEIKDNATQFKGFDLSNKTCDNKNTATNIAEQNTTFYDKAKKYLFGDYNGEIITNKKTIGVPYVLVVHKLFPMIKEFFQDLGYNVLLSPETDEDIITAAQKYAQAETCYPVKLIYGHMAWLAEKEVDYIFLPSILTMKHECSNVHHNYRCVYMQSAPKLVFESMGLDKKGMRLLNPAFSLDFGQQAMAGAMVGVGVALGKSKSACMKALMKGAMAVRKHTALVEKLGEELFNSLKPDEKVLVIVTRTYGIDDPVLNMGIPQELLRRGYKVITLSHLPAHSMDISQEYENLYWPFGQHIISGAKLIANHPNLYAVYLTNHGCGPDTMISHLFRKEMGTKPYLNIEVDEHFSKVGVVTRIEAFLNSLDSQKTETALDKAEYFYNLPKRKTNILKKPQKDSTLYLPYLYPYSDILSNTLNSCGYNAKVLPQTNAESLALGRSRTISKEYLSFAALVGDILKKASENKNIHIVVPQTEGSETDGMYPRVIYDLLPNNNTTLVAPILETLPFKSANCKKLFLSFLAGDIVMASPKDQRKELLRQIIDAGDLSISFLTQVAKQISCEDRQHIAIVGEPYILFNSYLNEGLFNKIEQEGRSIMWMPMSEYLCFMWKKRATTKEEKKAVDSYIDQMNIISKALEKNNPFSQNLDLLFDISQKYIPELVGANGAYRFGKQIYCNDCIAVINASSMYENVETILNLAKNERNVPMVSLSFEGSNDVLAEQRLRSFLYYMD